MTKKEGLKSWEVNFGYIEHGEKRNALVKLRLCQECSFKLNFHHRRKEVKSKKERIKPKKIVESHHIKNPDYLLWKRRIKHIHPQ